MKQTIPKPIGALTSLAHRTLSGAKLHGENVGLAHNTHDKIQDEVVAVEQSVCNYRQACSVLQKSYVTLSEKTESAKALATITREILKLKLGNQFSDKWSSTGFQRSLAMPRSAEDLHYLLLLLSGYLANNPGLQVPDLNVTAVYLRDLHEQLKDGINTINVNLTQTNQLLSVRNESVTRLRKRMSDLVAELKQIISPMDGRWKSFGLNLPGAEETPDAPKNVTVAIVHETTALLTFSPSPRANYYRVYERVVGVDAEPIYVASPTDPNFTREDLPRGASVEFYICAINDGGDSALSEPVVVKIE